MERYALYYEDMSSDEDGEWCKYADAQAAIDDLAGKLAAAQAELHRLRVRVGLGEGGPDWSQAPEWAQWWAVDESGEAYWYEKEPSLLIHDGMWNNREGQAIRFFPAVSWYVSLRQRPQVAHE